MDPKIIKLFEKMKANNFFWSYSREISAEDMRAETLVETVLKYGDVADIRLIFNYYGRDYLLDVWAKRILFDSRFRKLNFYLAKVFFEVDPEQIKKERPGDDRGNKLRMLASRHATGAGKTQG